MSHNSGFAGTAAAPRGAEGPTGGSGEPDDEAAIAAALGVTCERRKRAEAAAVARAATLAKAAQLAWRSPAVTIGNGVVPSPSVMLAGNRRLQARFVNPLAQ